MNDADDIARKPRTAVREGEVAGGSLRFRYREAGKGDAVLCLGGSVGFSPMRERLAERRRVVELMLPDAGLGANAAMVPAVSAAIAALGIDRFDLMAAGDGAALALLMALERPQDLRALALLGPMLFASNGQPGAGIAEEFLGRLGGLKVPSLAVFGTRDAVSPVEAARHYRERISACNLVFVYDAGHAMEEERPEAVAALIADFFERHDLFLVRSESDLIYP